MPWRRDGSVGNNTKHVYWISVFKKEVKIAIATLSQSTGWGAACGS